MTEYKKWLWLPMFFYKRGEPHNIPVPHDYDKHTWAASWGIWTIYFRSWGWSEGKAND